MADVLIVGGGLSGISAAAFLTRHKVSCLLVERAEQVRRSARGHRLTGGTLRVLRDAGLEQQVRSTELYGESPVLVTVDTLAGEQLPQPSEGSESVVRCNETDLERVLLAAAREGGAEVRLGTELVDFEVTSEGVTATLVEAASGSRTTLEAAYLLAADSGGIRERLGIAVHGPGVLGRHQKITFRAALAGRERGYLVGAVGGVLLPEDEPDGWSLTMPGEELSPERCVELIRTAAGGGELAVELVSVQAFEIAAQVADTFVAGRVILLGKSAYTTPPTPGLNGNARIQDAHNLAWKLARVLRGEAGPGLLDTFDAERRPIAELTMTDMLTRLPPQLAPGSHAERHTHD